MNFMPMDQIAKMKWTNSYEEKNNHLTSIRNRTFEQTQSEIFEFVI